jgi:hypothetical protein
VTPSGGPIYRSSKSALAPGSLSLEFDGTDARLCTADDDELCTLDNNLLDFGLTDSFTVELFFQTTVTAERTFIQKQQNFSGTMLYELWITSDGKVRFDIQAMF